MTGKELKTAVSRLGYAKSLSDLEDLFLEAANLSLCQITRIFPLQGVSETTVARGTGYYTPVCGDALDPSFLAFSHMPLLRDGTPLIPGRDYLLHGGELLLPPEQTGKPLSVFYLRRPRKVTEDNLDLPLTCPGQAEHLLPLLTAAILWAQDDPDLADRYHALYRNAETELMRSRAADRGAGYAAVGGWDA